MSKAPQHFVMGEELFELHTVNKETLLSSLFTGILLRGDGCCHEQNKRNFSSNSLLESMSFSSLRPRECTEVRRTPRGAFLPSHFSTANTQEKQRNSNLTSQHRQHDMAAPLCLPHVDANCAFGSVSCRQRVMWQKIRLLTDEDRRFYPLLRTYYQVADRNSYY